MKSFIFLIVIISIASAIRLKGTPSSIAPSSVKPIAKKPANNTKAPTQNGQPTHHGNGVVSVTLTNSNNINVNKGGGNEKGGDTSSPTGSKDKVVINSAATEADKNIKQQIANAKTALAKVDGELQKSDVDGALRDLNSASEILTQAEAGAQENQEKATDAKIKAEFQKDIDEISKLEQGLSQKTDSVEKLDKAEAEFKAAAAEIDKKDLNEEEMHDANIKLAEAKENLEASASTSDDDALKHELELLEKELKSEEGKLTKEEQMAAQHEH